MSDLIDRQNAIDAMCSACGHDCDKSKFVYNAPQDEQVIMCPEHYALSTLPSASTDLSTFSDKLWKIAYERGKEEGRKKGKWIFIHPLQADDEGAYICSNCHRGDWDIKPTDKYCKFCGMAMDIYATLLP